MATINTNLSPNYCLSWGLWEAIREILQNAVDQSSLNADNEMLFHYNEIKQELQISNKSSSLDRSSILLGETSKSNDDSTIGQHGEGYKIALLVLSRLNKKVLINNYQKSEVWTPFFAPDKQLDGKKVLKIHIRKYIFKKPPNHDLIFKIQNITPQEWKELQPYFLPFNSIQNTFSSDSGEILFDKAFQGKIFVNGLFVDDVSKNEAKTQFGYNFKPTVISLDRDRKRIAGFDLDWACSKIISDWSISQNFDGIEILKKMVRYNYNESRYLDSFSYRKNTISSELISDMTDNYGLHSFPVISQKEFDHVKNYFPRVKPVMVTEGEKKFISSVGKYQSINAFTKEENLGTDSQSRNPAELLAVFYARYEDELSTDMLDDLSNLIDLSKNWVNATNNTPSDEDLMYDELLINNPIEE